jgi:hypothetical protein
MVLLVEDEMFFDVLGKDLHIFGVSQAIHIAREETSWDTVFFFKWEERGFFLSVNLLVA